MPNLIPTESTTWDGKPQLQLEVSASETRPLYLVKFRPERNVAASGLDDLSLADRAQGVEMFQPYAQVLRHYPGHDTGSLHSVRASAVLTWTVEPGDEVLHVFRVEFSGRRTLIWELEYSDSDTYCQPVQWLKAECDPIQNGVLISCDSTPGRSAMLGEDTLDAAFGNDNLQCQLEAALEDDLRKCLCEIRYEATPEGDFQQIVWPWYQSKRVTAKRTVAR